MQCFQALSQSVHLPLERGDLRLCLVFLDVPQCTLHILFKKLRIIEVIFLTNSILAENNKISPKQKFYVSSGLASFFAGAHRKFAAPTNSFHFLPISLSPFKKGGGSQFYCYRGRDLQFFFCQLTLRHCMSAGF